MWSPLYDKDKNSHEFQMVAGFDNMPFSITIKEFVAIFLDYLSKKWKISNQAHLQAA